MEASALHAPSAPGRIPGPGPLLLLRGDDQLIALFRKGHDEAFEVIFARYRARLLAYTGRMLGGSRSDAEDATQDVFISAYRALRHDDRPITLRAWLYRIAHNRCIDQIRRPAPGAPDVLDASRTPLRDPVVEAERNEKLRQLMTDIGRLPEQQRSAALMRWFDGMAYAEIAAALGVSTNAVKSLLVRARVSVAEADEARNAACAGIRSELADAFDRGVRSTGRSCKHLRDCPPCRAYKDRLRGLDRALGGAAPRHGAFAAIAKLLGIGGAGSGAAVGAGTVAVGGPVAAKITALVCCGVAAAGVARLDTPPRASVPAPAPGHASRTATPTTATPTAAVLARVDRRVPAAAAPARRDRLAPGQATTRPRPTMLGDLREGALSVHRAAPAPEPAPMTPHSAARSTGGTLAPDDLAPAADEPPLREAPVGPAAAGDAPAIAPPHGPATDGPAPAPEAPATTSDPATSSQPAAEAPPAPPAGASAPPPPAP